MLVNKRCTYCGKQFQAHTIKTRFCSRSCNQKDYKFRAKQKRLNENIVDKTVNKIPFKDLLEISKSKVYLEIKDCALLLNVSQSTISRLINRGELIHFRIMSRVLIRQIDLEDYCKKELVKTSLKQESVKRPSNEVVSFNKDDYYYMGEIPKYYKVSSRSIERHIKSKGIEKIKIGRFNYVLKSDIKKLFGAPSKIIIND
ncbi:excisionase family DNA binding protein [Winogradskyella eximia]|uniref:Excisionase family DNA binding protein n=1 Tax=Winogradskyella eximia TaxID=262006 RepID=A0A3D9GZC9_9FLAO|nr:helix-turn-helix domain-containing protein [Winogradskyella eximia]RED42602.1 excisionase family DNA binding protein [Winogradskyella eximia]